MRYSSSDLTPRTAVGFLLRPASPVTARWEARRTTKRSSRKRDKATPGGEAENC